MTSKKLYRTLITPNTIKWREQLRIILSSRVSKNTAILLGIVVMVNAMSIPFIAFIARTLGADGFGMYSVGITFANILMMAIDTGTGKILTREISADEANAPVTISAQILPKPIIFVLVFGLSMLFCFYVGYNESQILIIAISAVTALFMAGATASRAVFHAFQRMEFDAIGLLSERVITITCAVIATMLGYGIIGVVVAFLIGNLVDASLSWFFVRRGFVHRLIWPDLNRVMHSLRIGFPLFLAAFFSTLYLRSSVIILDRVSGSSAAGWFNAAFQLLGLALFIPQMLGLAIFPVFSRLAKEEPNALLKVSWIFVRLMACFGFIMAFLIFFLSGWVVPLLYSQQFLPAIDVLQILAVGLPFTFASSILAQMLIATHRQVVVGRATLIAAVIHLGMCVSLAQLFGVTGAAYASVITEIIILVQYVLSIVRVKRSAVALPPIGK